MCNFVAEVGTRWRFIVVSPIRKVLLWMVHELEIVQSGTWGRLETERHGHMSFWSMGSLSCSWNVPVSTLQGTSNVRRSHVAIDIHIWMLCSSTAWFQKEKKGRKTNKEGCCNIIFPFSCFVEVLLKKVDWVSHKLKKYFCSSQGFKVNDSRRLKAEETGLRGAACSALSCVSLVAYIGCRIVLVCSSHSGNLTKPTV